MRIFKLHVDTEVDKQTILFFYVQSFLLPEDEVTEEFIFFLISHPNQLNMVKHYRKSIGTFNIEKCSIIQCKEVKISYLGRVSNF